MVRAKRQYDSSGRKNRALDTRAQILKTAAVLFTRKGFAATLEQIAEKSRVSTPTVYSVFGSKRGIVEALILELKKQTDVGSRFREILESRSPQEMLKISASITRSYSEKGGAFISALQAAAAADGEVGSIWNEAEKSRHRGQRVLVKRIAELGGLKKQLDPVQAGDMLWAFSSHGVYASLVGHCGWTPDQFEQWLFEETKKILLA